MGPHGGPRVGAGRPKKKVEMLKLTEVEVVAQSIGSQTPLEYMLTVMNDTKADASRRDRMAVAAAPYLHGRAADERVGKKEQRQADADKAAKKFSVQVAPKLVVNNR